MHRAVIVVPCYNEAQRLDVAGFGAFAGHPDVGLLFVDDGSTDETAAVLERLCAGARGQAGLYRLDRNRGKAEAVRLGMRKALEDGARLTGYFDADLATPPAEMLRLLDHLADSRTDVALAARVLLLGTDIVRKPLRHYLGRIFATCASFCLGIAVYDTQCGAKVFRRTPALEAALDEPFLARWAFDVELIGRLLTGTAAQPGVPVARFVEMSLQQWHDVAGSKIRLLDFPRMGVELWRIWCDLRRRRRALGNQSSVLALPAVRTTQRKAS